MKTALNGICRWLSLLVAVAIMQGCVQLPRTADQDPQIPQLRLNGHAFHGEAFGSPTAPVVIVLHGGPGADYRYLLGLSTLADQFRVVFYDQLGSGLSERVPAEQITVQSFVSDLDAVVEHFSPGRPVHLVGHSWGAMLASAYAGAYPDKVARMVLAEPGFLDVDTLGGLPSGGWPGWRVVGGFAWAWLGKWTVSNDGDPYAPDDWFLLRVFPLTQGEDELCDGKLPALQAWRFGSPAFKATLGRLMDDPGWGRTLDFAKGLDRYRGQVLFLRGACNRAQGEAHQRRMMSKFSPASRARLLTLDRAGHFMFNDQPQASVAAVRAFLSER